MPVSFYDAFSQASDNDQFQSQEVVRTFSATKKSQKRKANWPVLEPIEEDRGNRENEDPSVDEEEEELETATVVNFTIRDIEKVEMTDDEKKRATKLCNEEKAKAAGNEYVHSDSDVEIRSTCSTVFNYKEHCAACHHFMTSCKRCMMAYRKQREGRTRTNYISGGPNPFVRQLEENGDVDDEESGL